MIHLRDVLKGLLIGAANLLPGISGGTMAIALNVYEILIESLSICMKQPIRSLKLLWPYLLGGMMGLAGVTLIVEKTLKQFPYFTLLLFGGLVIGGLPAMMNKIQLKRVSLKHACFFIAGGALILFFTIVSSQAPQQEYASMLVLFILGFFLSLSMLIPGVSGSLILIMLGYYEGLVSACRQLLSLVYRPNFDSFFFTLSWLMPFGLGLTCGLLVFSKLVSYLLKHYSNSTYCFMLGIVIASLWVMLKEIPILSFSLVEGILGFVVFSVGILCTYVLEK